MSQEPWDPMSEDIPDYGANIPDSEVPNPDYEYERSQPDTFS